MKLMKLTIAFLFLVYPKIIFANEDSLQVEGSTGIFGVPFFMYSPETEFGFGGAGMYYFYPGFESSLTTNISNILVSTLFTTKKQISSEINYDIYLTNNDYRFYGRLAYAKFPYSFFGIGNENSDADEENYTPTFLTIETAFLKNIIRSSGFSVNTGIKLDFRSDRISEKQVNALLESGSIAGENGGIVSGAGVIINLDSRDNTFSSSSGEYAEIKAVFYKDIFFSDYNFNSYSFDIRKFIPVFLLDTTHVFAFNLMSRFTEGDVPFYMLSTFGGDKIMRGIYDGRFRDNHSLVIQAEYRLPLFWRFGFATFCGISQVCNNLSQLKPANMKIAYGFGVRFLIVPDEKIGGRLDFGFSKYGGQFYLSFSEAF